MYIDVLELKGMTQAYQWRGDNLPPGTSSPT